MSDLESEQRETATERTALMDGHIAEARPDREVADRIARKKKTKSERSYGVSTTAPIYYVSYLYFYLILKTMTQTHSYNNIFPSSKLLLYLLSNFIIKCKLHQIFRS